MNMTTDGKLSKLLAGNRKFRMELCPSHYHFIANKHPNLIRCYPCNTFIEMIRYWKICPPNHPKKRLKCISIMVKWRGHYCRFEQSESRWENITWRCRVEKAKARTIKRGLWHWRSQPLDRVSD